MDKIAHLQENIAQMQVHLAQAKQYKNNSRAEYLKGQIAKTKADIAALRARAKTLK